MRAVQLLPPHNDTHYGAHDLNRPTWDGLSIPGVAALPALLNTFRR